MKRLLLAGLFTLAAFAAACQTVLYRDQATLEWDAVLGTTDGQPWLPGDVVSYEVYIYDHIMGVADAQNPALLTLIGQTAVAAQLIVFPYRTVWAAGVRTKLVDGDGAVSYSAIAWSYIALDADGVAGPFVYSPEGLPGKPGALRDSGT